MHEYGLEYNTTVDIISMHDEENQANNNIYFPVEMFKGYGGAKTSFIANAVKGGFSADVVLISHINLLVAGWLIKKLNPSAKILLIAHGIEIWGKLNFFKRKMLNSCDKILCVSNFTLNTIAKKHALPGNKLLVLNNCLDPFLNNRQTNIGNDILRNKYSLSPQDIVLLTLTRLSVKDRYKGYDFVIEAMINLVAQNKNIKYLLAGGSSADEKLFLEQLIKNHGLKNNVVLAGYVAAEELATLFFYGRFVCDAKYKGRIWNCLY